MRSGRHVIALVARVGPSCSPWLDDDRAKAQLAPVVFLARAAPWCPCPQLDACVQYGYPAVMSGATRLPAGKDQPMRGLPFSRRVRHHLRLTQAEFSERFGIPIGTVRDWDQGRAEPDAAAMSLLRVISAYPQEAAAAQLSAKSSAKQ